MVSMLVSAIDHLVVTSRSREEGIAYISTLLGVSPQMGGNHPQMGTHNALLRLGDAMYLEVIAIDPKAPAPGRTRWFDLDHLKPPARPRLATWVIRADDVHDAVRKSPVPLGPVEIMVRDSLKWQITIRRDGTLALDGAAPSVIQWSTDEHPAAGLKETGCALIELEVRHPEAKILGDLLDKLGFSGPVVLVAPPKGERSGLVARIRTGSGIRVIGEP